MIANDQRCFLRSGKVKAKSEKLVFFLNFEIDQATGQHLVNFALAQYSDGTEIIFKGYSTCNDF